MRDDLLDAQTAVDWAIAQVPIVQKRIIGWSKTNPYRRFRETDAQAGYDFIGVSHDRPFEPLIYADVGAMINSMRSALDLLYAAIILRNAKGRASRKKAADNSRFPFCRRRRDVFAELRGLKNKQWLTDAEIKKIKSVRSYQGGNTTLYALHHLDIVRKHRRFLSVDPVITSNFISAWGGSRIEPHWHRLNGKTILYRCPIGTPFNPTQGNLSVSADIFLDEPALGLRHVQAIPWVRECGAHVTEVIALFDGP